MNACLAKYFGNTKITKKEVINILKNLLCATVDELQKLKKDRELPVCLLLLVNALFNDMDTGQFSTISIILDTIF